MSERDREAAIAISPRAGVSVLVRGLGARYQVSFRVVQVSKNIGTQFFLFLNVGNGARQRSERRRESGGAVASV